MHSHCAKPKKEKKNLGISVPGIEMTKSTVWERVSIRARACVCFIMEGKPSITLFTETFIEELLHFLTEADSLGK